MIASQAAIEQDGVLHPLETQRDIDHAADWIRANGGNPANILLDQTIRVADGNIAYTECVKDEKGHFRLRGSGEDVEIVTRMTVLILTVPFEPLP